MRILLWPPLYNPLIGGVERYTERLALGLTRLGCTVEVITNNIAAGAASDTVAGMRVTRLPFPASRQGDLAAVKEVRDGLRRVVERLQPEVLNLQTSGPSIADYELHRRALPMPLVTTFHGIYPRDGSMPSLLTQHFAHCAATKAGSAATKTSLVAAVGSRAADMDLLLPPIDDVAVPPVPAPHGIHRVLGVGRLTSDKGWNTLLHAMPIVRKSIPDAELVLVGDGPERARLDGTIAELGLESFVRLMGIVDDKERVDLLDACSVVCVPSLDEGFGMVAIEASARMRAIVASSVGGLVEAVVDGVTGLLVPPADAAALATALVNVLANPALADELGRRGGEFSTKFGIDALASATLDSYRRALLPQRI